MKTGGKRSPINNLFIGSQYILPWVLKKTKKNMFGVLDFLQIFFLWNSICFLFHRGMTEKGVAFYGVASDNVLIYDFGKLM